MPALPDSGCILLPQPGRRPVILPEVNHQLESPAKGGSRTRSALPASYLHRAGLLARWKGKPSGKGGGFIQPLQPHEHWHVDISYLNLNGTFYYLCSVLDGCSRYIVAWEIRETMREAEVEIVLQRAREKHPEARPRIISDNGPQFIAKDFKEFIQICGMTRVRTSPYYPQSNGKIERWHQSFKAESLRPGVPLSLEDARRLADGYVQHYNTVRLHSALGYVTPLDRLEGRAPAIHAARDRKLEEAREKRRRRRQGIDMPPLPVPKMMPPEETDPGSAGGQPGKG